MQTTIFDMLYPKYKITKPIRLIEFFAGYGSQALALKYLGVEFEHWKICEWAVKSIQAYKDIHFTDAKNDGLKLGSNLPERTYNILYSMGISQNYNEPMTLEQIKRLTPSKAEQILDNIHITHNLVNIQQVKGEMLEIVDTDKYDYILTYSFPCQDLSLAGKGKGMSDTSTRSGMLWEVERILKECNELGNLPQILLMENVPQVHSQDNVADFNKWQLELEKLGYKNYFQDLIATDYGIPQTRNRTFMISILGDYSYTFPPEQPLKLKLKDMLEDEVDEKYYLSDKMIDFFTYNEKKQKENGNGFRFNVSDGNIIAKTITTRAGSRMDDNFIKIGNKSLRETLEQNNIDDTCYIDTYNKRIDKDKSGTITTGVSFRNNTFLAIKNATKQKLTTQNNLGVVTIGNYSPSNHNASRIVDKEHSAPTVMENHGTITATQTSDLRIRKLTPRECFRLMGVKDEDYEKCAKNQSDSSLYHLAGDSIVVNVLMAIFKELLESKGE